MPRPNLVVILVDDMGYGDFGCFGNADVQTPALDHLAEQSVCLGQHYSASAVCAPARAGLLTGRYPIRTGAIDTLEGRGLDRLALREVTVADSLKSAGYATGLVGKWHLGAIDPRYHPNRRGFDEFAGFRGGWQDYYQWRLDKNGDTHAPDGRYLTDVLTDEAVGFIDRHQKQPFFLHVTYNAPHFPLQVPDGEADPFRETGKFTEGVSLIYGMNRRMDAGVGRILDALDKHGLAENTLVVFTSDNGPQFGGHGDMCVNRYNGHFNGYKGLVLEGGIRVPAIVRWPAGLPAGTFNTQMVHFVDWLPTLLAAAGVDPPTDVALDGNNVLPVLRGEATAPTEQRFWQWCRYVPRVDQNAAMRDGPWKLVQLAGEGHGRVTPEDGQVDRALKYEPDTVPDISRDTFELPEVGPSPAAMLFNLDDDPYEQNDLAAAQPDRLRRMQQALLEWFEHVEADRQAIEDDPR